MLKKCVFVGAMGIVGVMMLLETSMLASQFGISNYAAKKVIDISTGAGSIWMIIAVVGGSAGWGAALLAAAKYLVKRYGKAAAASF